MTVIENTKGRSPYARKGKTPFRYSDYYQRWTKSLADTGLYSEETEAADRSFRRAFGIPYRKPVDVRSFA